MGTVCAVRPPAEALLSPVDLIGLLLAVVLFVYLVVALLYPENFQ